MKCQGETLRRFMFKLGTKGLGQISVCGGEGPVPDWPSRTRTKPQASLVRNEQ